MNELFKAFDELNVNKDYTLTIVYTKYCEWLITITRDIGWDSEIVVDVAGDNRPEVIKKVIENIKKI